jgi:hypothetical protein
MRIAPNGKPWCNACYAWSRRHPGQDPAERPRRKRAQATRPNRSMAETVRILRDAAASDTDECLYFDGRRELVAVRVHGVTHAASRAVWIYAQGDPGELEVLHACNEGSGETGCINPRHLYLGTQAQNIQDTQGARRTSKGTERWNAKLTAADVFDIREQYAQGGVTQAQLAKRYGVDRATIGDAIRRETWDWTPN